MATSYVNPKASNMIVNKNIDLGALAMSVIGGVSFSATIMILFVSANLCPVR